MEADKDLKIADDTLNFNLWGTKVDEQTDTQPRRLQVVQALGIVHVVESFNGFQLYENARFDNQVGNVITDDHSVILNFQTGLLLKIEGRFSEFVRQRIFVYFFKESTSQRISDFVDASNDLFSDLV
jgi:hypothetical protein